MKDRTTEQQLADILRVLQGDKLAKTPGLVSDVLDILKRYSKTERVLAKLTTLVTDQNADIVELKQKEREQELEIVKLKTRVRLIWKIVGGVLGSGAAVGGTLGTLEATLQIFSG